MPKKWNTFNKIPIKNKKWFSLCTIDYQLCDCTTFHLDITHTQMPSSLVHTSSSCCWNFLVHQYAWKKERLDMRTVPNPGYHRKELPVLINCLQSRLYDLQAKKEKTILTGIEHRNVGCWATLGRVRSCVAQPLPLRTLTRVFLLSLLQHEDHVCMLTQPKCVPHIHDATLLPMCSERTTMPISWMCKGRVII